MLVFYVNYLFTVNLFAVTCETSRLCVIVDRSGTFVIVRDLVTNTKNFGDKNDMTLNLST